jgi:hypothetical protein
MSGPSLLRIPRYCEKMGVCSATAYHHINDGVVASVTIGGVRQIVEAWGPSPPPRAGRAPSFEELIQESAQLPRRPVRPTPAGVHRGRPRKVINGSP